MSKRKVPTLQDIRATMERGLGKFIDLPESNPDMIEEALYQILEEHMPDEPDTIFGIMIAEPWLAIRTTEGDTSRNALNVAYDAIYEYLKACLWQMVPEDEPEEEETEDV